MKVYYTTVHPAIMDKNLIKRQPIIKNFHDNCYYKNNFDETTLWYDAIQLKDRVVLVCPKLRNIYSEIKSGIFKLNDKIVKNVTVKHFKRNDLIILKKPGRFQTISFYSKYISVKAVISECMAEDFSASNCAMIINKDNELDWIRDPNLVFN